MSQDSNKTPGDASVASRRSFITHGATLAAALAGTAMAAQAGAATPVIDAKVDFRSPEGAAWGAVGASDRAVDRLGQTA